MSMEKTGSALPPATDEERDVLASKLVDRLSIWSGVAGLLPIPLVDIAAVGGVQLYMLRKLSEIYGVPFSENRGKAVLSSLIGAIVPATTASGVASFFKFVPGLGTVAGTLTMAPVSAGATYIIGKVFIQHFASGGTLLDFNPPDYREFIKSQREKLGTRSGAAPTAQSGPGSRASPKETATTSP
jgi:uncharacterized protein (DUF697 family)